MEVRRAEINSGLAAELQGDLYEPGDADVLRDRLSQIRTGDAFRHRGLVAYDGDQLRGYAHVHAHNHDDELSFLDVVVAGSSDVGQITKQLVTAALAEAGSELHWWTRGKMVAVAEGLRSELGAVEARRVLRMERKLGLASAPNIDVRAFTEDDASRVVAINNAAFAEHPDRSSWTDPELFSTLASLDNHYEDLLLAPAGDVKGFCWTKRHPDHRGEIFVLATHPDAHGSGLGSALLDAGLHHIANQGAKTAVLYVESSNEHVIALFKRHGFTLDANQLVAFHVPKR